MLLPFPIGANRISAVNSTSISDHSDIESKLSHHTDWYINIYFFLGVPTVSLISSDLEHDCSVVNGSTGSFTLVYNYSCLPCPANSVRIQSKFDLPTSHNLAVPHITGWKAQLCHIWLTKEWLMTWKLKTHSLRFSFLWCLFWYCVVE